ncbi:MAG TPA: hypothetical protein VFU41_07210 [Gemmatimonadales bacterium]|nr:hypothetical protein [Gemmatimonadales bacterium]
MAQRHAVLVTAALFGVLLVGTTVAAQEAGQTVIKRGTITEDLYLAGGTVEVRADVQGDVTAVGGQVLIDQRVAGDVLVGGGSVDVPAEVLDDVRAAGGTVTLRGRIAGDAVAAGGEVELGPDAIVGGRAWLSGGEVRVAGRVTTHLKAAAERIVISGAVDGDVDLAAEEIEVRATARIRGKLTYRSRREARIDPAAEIGGGVTRVAVKPPSLAGRVAGRLVFVAASGLLGAVLILAFPGFSTGTVGTLGQDPWKSLGLGAATLVCGPLFGIVLMVTVVGAAVGVAVLAVYGLALVAGFLTGALYVGERSFRLVQRTTPTSVGSWIGLLLIGLAVVVVLKVVPFIGGLFCLAVLLLGLGALVLQAYRAWQAGRAESGAVGDTA